MSLNLSIEKILILPKLNKNGEYAARIPGLESTCGEEYFGHIKAIIFDLDMTLVDTSSLEQLRSQRNWSEVYKKIPITHLMYYRDEDCNCVNCDPVCAGCDMPLDLGAGIITSSPRKYAELVCKYHNIQIPILTAYHDTKRHKPDPEPIYHACSQLNLDPSEIAYVGDSISDMHAILQAGGTGIHLISTQKKLNEAYDIFNNDLNKTYVYKARERMYDYSKYYIISDLITISNSVYD